MTSAAMSSVRDYLVQGEPLTSAIRHVGGQQHAAEPHAAGEPWQLLREAFAEIKGAGAVIQPLLEDPAVTDVLVNGDDEIWVDSGHGLRRIHAAVDARMLALRLATLAGKRLDEAAPIVDGRLPDGTRLHAVLPPLVHGEAHISLRTPPRSRWRWQDLLDAGFLTEEFAAVITQLLRRRANILVSGAAGSGKTTLAAAVLSLVPASERILIIEEAAELMPIHPHVVHLQARSANIQGAGEIGLADLLRAAMRMRPDRLVLGECRGREVREMLSAFNTGHDGGWATVHANTAADVPARLIALGALAGMDAPTVAVQAVSGLDAVLHVRRDPDGHRRLDHIAVVAPGFTVDTALGRAAGDPSKVVEGAGWARLARRLDGD